MSPDLVEGCFVVTALCSTFISSAVCGRLPNHSWRSKDFPVFMYLGRYVNCMRICAVVSFVAVKLRIVTIRIMSVRQPAARPHGTTLLPLDGF